MAASEGGEFYQVFDSFEGFVISNKTNEPHICV
jgi:hypothetical protein